MRPTVGMGASDAACFSAALSSSSRWCLVLGISYINVQRFRGGLVFKAHRRLYHSTLGLRVIKKTKMFGVRDERLGPPGDQVSSSLLLSSLELSDS